MAFTNVPVGKYTVWLEVLADYQACSTRAGMALIPAGCFEMGDAFDEGNPRELPVHEVCVTSDFHMDLHEVTNAEYGACVDRGACTALSITSSETRSPYFGDPAFDDYPVLFVDWSQATALCSSLGTRGDRPTSTLADRDADWLGRLVLQDHAQPVRVPHLVAHGETHAVKAEVADGVALARRAQAFG
ncbi:MAG: formylglycine-generating enzyme family protein [bacterium]|nr:formylglycine-generating enzyme family protein [bacterium]